MEQQKKLPNANTALVLGIISYIACCFTIVGGILFSVIALILTNKDTKLYNQSPEEYSNFSQVKTAKVVAIIGLVLSILMTIIVIVGVIAAGGIEAFREIMEEAQSQYGM